METTKYHFRGVVCHWRSELAARGGLKGRAHFMGFVVDLKFAAARALLCPHPGLLRSQPCPPLTHGAVLAKNTYQPPTAFLVSALWREEGSRKDRRARMREEPSEEAYESKVQNGETLRGCKSNQMPYKWRFILMSVKAICVQRSREV